MLWQLLEFGMSKFLDHLLPDNDISYYLKFEDKNYIKIKTILNIKTIFNYIKNYIKKLFKNHIEPY